MVRRIFWIMPIAAWLVPSTTMRGDSGVPADAAATRHTHVDVRISPIVDLHFYLRWLAEDGKDRTAPPWCAAAVEVVRKLDADLGRSPLTWGGVERGLDGCTTAADAAVGFAALPGKLRYRVGSETRVLRLWQPTHDLARVYANIEPEFLRTVWPTHRSAAEALARRIETELEPKQDACFAAIRESLDMDDPHLTIPVYVVAVEPSPGMVTHSRFGAKRGGVGFIAASAADDTQSLELVLHESIHALDIAEARETVLVQLRRRLVKAGLSRRDPGIYDVPHALMFVQAAATIRRFVDKSHRDYGEVSGYYATIPRAAAAVRPAWTDFLDGKITRNEAIDRIIDAFAAPHGAAANP